jgi:ATP-dependent helicase/nuclease subunit B
MARGVITADPFWRGGSKNACLYCDYAAACQFREGVGGDRKRPLKEMKQPRFWKAMDGKEEDQDAVSAD